MLAPRNVIPALGSAALAAVTLATATPALAGGVGVVASGGTYSERVFFYDADGTQYRQNQMIGTYGTGIEAILGDRDDKISGFARLMWQGETPEGDPVARTSVDANFDGALNAWREDTRHTGLFAVGIQGGLIGQPDKGMLTVTALLGSAFMTDDHTEFVYGDIGVGGTLRMGRQIEGFANLTAHGRFRKWFRPGASTAIGVRFLID